MFNQGQKLRAPLVLGPLGFVFVHDNVCFFLLLDNFFKSFWSLRENKILKKFLANYSLKLISDFYYWKYKTVVRGRECDNHLSKGGVDNWKCTCTDRFFSPKWRAAPGDPKSMKAVAVMYLA